ncbi:MAG: CrcB family protein [Solirubrobacterales bacterium]|nr:CrcB family protein [Solirubrobacterales bacterium]
MTCVTQARPGSPQSSWPVTIVALAIAGAAGVLARYGISNAFHGATLSWATVAINVVGSFLLGCLIVMPASWISGDARTVLGVGLLGGFTTFSTFSVQAFLDFETGEPLRALAYIAASVLLGLAAAAAGYYLTRSLVH